MPNKLKENVPGSYYVTEDCICCKLCQMVAPSNFTMEEEEGHFYIYKQPESPEEEKQCIESMDHCPVDAIGKDSAE